MGRICNSCGREFDDASMILHTTEDGTEYFICGECENNGVKVEPVSVYYVCKKCGFPHSDNEFNRTCKFCEGNDGFEKIELTAVEEELLDTNPNKLYREKLGKKTADKIADWIESPARKSVGERHKRDRHIDTAFVVGIIVGYILLDWDIREYVGNKYMFLGLLIPTALVFLTAPIFKAIDRKPRKKPLPLWSIFVVMAIFSAIYWIIIKLFG